MNSGTFPAVVVEGLLGRAGSGNEQVAVSFNLTDESGQETNESITWYGTFTDKAFPYTLGTLRTCGLQGDDVSDLSGLPGTPVSLVLDWDEYNGKKRLKVKYVNSPGGGAVLKEQLAPDEAKSFAQRMMSKVRLANAAANAPKVNGAPPRQAPKARQGVLSPPPPYDNTDDIPF